MANTLLQSRVTIQLLCSLLPETEVCVCSLEQLWISARLTSNQAQGEIARSKGLVRISGWQDKAGMGQRQAVSAWTQRRLWWEKLPRSPHMKAAAKSKIKRFIKSHVKARWRSGYDYPPHPKGVYGLDFPDPCFCSIQAWQVSEDTFLHTSVYFYSPH